MYIRVSQKKQHFPWKKSWPRAKESFSDVGFENTYIRFLILFIPRSNNCKKPFCGFSEILKQNKIQLVSAASLIYINPYLTRGGGLRSPFYIFSWKITPLSSIFYSKNTKKSHLKIWDNILKSLNYNFAFSKIWKIVAKKSYLIDGLLRPPVGGLVLKNRPVWLGLNITDNSLSLEEVPKYLRIVHFCSSVID